MLIQQNARKDTGGHAVSTENARLGLVGSVKDSDCIIVGDIIDSAATMVRAAEELKKNGAKKVYAFAPHGLFNGTAVSRLSNSVLEEVVVTDSCPLSAEAVKEPKIRQISLAPLLAESIRRVHMNKSVSSLFSAPLTGKGPAGAGEAEADPDSSTDAEGSD
jgi:ribose-phosphate pyrophosphokinase